MARPAEAVDRVDRPVWRTRSQRDGANGSRAVRSNRDPTTQHLQTGTGHSFGGEFVELVPNERLRYTDRFDDPNLPGEIQVTVTLKTVSVGTEINIVQEGLPDVIPLEACYLGWGSRCKTWHVSQNPKSLNSAATAGIEVASPAGCRARFAACS